MSTLHIVYVPATLLAGLWLGYYLALRNVKARGGTTRTEDDELRDYDG